MDTTDATTTKVLVKTFPGGGSQTTYFDASSNVLGYSDTFVDSETNATNTNYNDANYNWLGSQSSDPQNGFSNTYFTTTQYASDGTTITGYLETGTDKQVDPVTGETIFERSFNYSFDENHELVSGTETENGIIITYGANWEVTSRKVTVFTDGVLNDGFSVVSNADLVQLPPSLQVPPPGTFKIIQVEEVDGVFQPVDSGEVISSISHPREYF